jgi:hypothetical protein
MSYRPSAPFTKSPAYSITLDCRSPPDSNPRSRVISCAKAAAANHTIAAIVLMTASAAWADGVTTDVSGYGTVGGTFTSDGKFAYVHNATEFAGASNSIDVGLESRIGVQAVVTFDSQWSVTAQEVAKLRGTSNFDPGTEWLFAQYQPISDLKVRLGRVVLPTFLLSDTINVGYAAPWFRPPNDVYDAEGFDHLDGGQVLWQQSLGAFQLNLEAVYGSAEGSFNAAGIQLSAKSRNTFNAAISISWRDLLVRYAETNLNVAATLPLSASESISLDLHDRFHCVGLQYDDGKALLMGEWTKRNENNLPVLNEPLANDTSWYLAAGWRFSKFTPLVMYSVLDITKSALQSPASYHTWDASLRYDVVRNLDLKFQISRAQAANNAYWVQGNRKSDEYVNVYSFGADFVF